MGIKNLKSYSHGELQQQPSLLFENTTLVSPDHNIISGYILIKGSHIAGLGEGATPEDLLTDATVIDASDFLITPSFINAHSHVAMNMFRDLAHQQESMIYKLFFPWEKNLDKEIVGALSFPYILGGLLSGTSTFADHYYFEEGIILALKAFGLKGIIGETTADLGSAFPSYDKWQGTKKWLESWPYDTDYFRPILAPHAMDSCSEKLLKEMANFAKHNKLGLHMHLSQTQQELDFCQKNYNMTAVEFASACGVLNDTTIAVHLVSAKEEDLKIIKDSNCYFGFTPASEIIYEHLPQLDKILELEIPLLIGTDCAAACDGADLISEMKLAHLLSKDRGYNKDLTSKILSSCTHLAAQAFGCTNWSTLKTGAKADLNFFEKSLETLPLQIPQENLIFSHSSQTLKHVMVNGDWVLFNKMPTKIDMETATKEFLKAFNIFKERLK